MDIYCATCGEPWDTEHLRQDLIYDVGAHEDEAEHWLKVPQKDRLSPFYRDLFRSEGWEFGSSLFDIRRCSACPEGASLDPERASLRTMIVDLYGDDEDAIAFTFEDFQL